MKKNAFFYTFEFEFEFKFNCHIKFTKKKSNVPYEKIWQKLLKATALSGLPGQAELDRVAPLVADPSRRNSTKSKHKHKQIYN